MESLWSDALLFRFGRSVVRFGILVKLFMKAKQYMKVLLIRMCSKIKAIKMSDSKTVNVL